MVVVEYVGGIVIYTSPQITLLCDTTELYIDLQNPPNNNELLFEINDAQPTINIGHF